MAIKIMMWNIEQYGTTRSKYKNRVDRIADVVAYEKPDVFVTLELRTKDPGAALHVAGSIKDALYYNHNLGYECILTHFSFFEHYAYFYNPLTVLPCTVAAGGQVLYDYNNSLQNLTLVKATNGLSTTNATITKGTPLLNNHFPLLDYPQRAGLNPGANGRRPPGAGFFKTVQSNQYFSVITWHNETAMTKKRTGRTRKSFMVGPGVISMQRIANAGFVQNSDLIVMVTENGTTNPKTFNQVIFTGDFNVDPITNPNEFQGLDTFSHMVTNASHISHYIDEEGEEFNELVHCLDNSLESRAIAQNNNIKARADVFPLDLWLKNQKAGRKCLVNMLEDSWLVNFDELHRLALEDTLRGLDHYCDKRTHGTVYKEYKDEIVKEINGQDLCDWIRKPATARTFTNKLDTVLTNLKVKNKTQTEMGQIRQDLAPVSGEVAKLVKKYALDFSRTVSIYDNIKKFPGSVSTAQALFLIRMILSDHLPVVTTINNW